MTDEERGPPSPGQDGDTPTKRCERCGAAIDTSDWYPVTNERNEDGSIQLYDFCSEDCQAAWLDDRSD